MNKTQYIDKKSGLAIGASAVVGTQLISMAPASASVQDVQDTLTSVAGIATAASGIVILAMGVRIAIKQVNRVMTKG